MQRRSSRLRCLRSRRPHTPMTVPSSGKGQPPDASVQPSGATGEHFERPMPLGAHGHGAVPVPLGRPGCSRQFGRASAPMIPHRVTGAPSPALARSWGGLCRVGHPGFVPLPAAVAPTIAMKVWPTVMVPALTHRPGRDARRRDRVAVGVVFAAAMSSVIGPVIAIDLSFRSAGSLRWRRKLNTSGRVSSARPRSWRSSPSCGVNRLFEATGTGGAPQMSSCHAKCYSRAR
jgi:hypothetical protein